MRSGTKTSSDLTSSYCFKAAIMPDLAGLDDVTNCASPRVTIRGSRSGQINPFPSPMTETEYRRSKNHLQFLTNCVDPGFELTPLRRIQWGNGPGPRAVTLSS
nr:unnamed protein product [Spirometra erinaceieuropaei]